MNELSKQVSITNEESLFKIHKIFGSDSNNFTNNFSSKLIAYNIENIIVIWNYASNVYTYLSNPNNDIILSLTFYKRNPNYIFAISKKYIYVWDINIKQIIYCFKFNKNNITSNIQNIVSTTSENDEYLYIFANTFIAVYQINSVDVRLTYKAHYAFKIMKHNIVSINSVINNGCKFITLTENKIQIWKLSFYDSENSDCVIKCLSKIDINEINEQYSINLNKFSSIDVDNSDYIYVLCNSGNIILMDEYFAILSITKCKHKNCSFNNISIGDRYISISTSKGAIELWNKDNLQYIKSISYPYRLRYSNNKGINSNKIMWFNCEYSCLNGNDTILISKYSDNLLCILNIKSSNLIRYNISHWDSILSLKGLNYNIYSPSKFINKEYNNAVITSSLDQTLCIYNNNKLIRIIDIRNIMNSNLSYMNYNSNSNKIYITAISHGINNNDDIIAVGDNFGYIRILNIKYKNEIICNIASNVSKSKVVSLSFDKYSQYLCVHRSNNEVTFFHLKRNITRLKPLLILQKYNDNIHTNNNIIQKSVLLKHKSLWQNENDLQCWIGTTNNSSNIVLKTFYFNEIYGNYQSKFCNKCYFTIPNNKNNDSITNFNVHPSEEYIIITTLNGYLYLYNILTTQIIYTINCQYYINNCLIDPSGLYLFISLKTDNNTYNFDNNFGDKIDIYQIGTKQYVTTINDIGYIEHYIFSRNADYLYVSSTNGTVKVIEISDGMRVNIKNVLKNMRMNSKFWSHYPIIKDSIKHDNGIKVDSYQTECVTQTNELNNGKDTPLINISINNELDNELINNNDNIIDGDLITEYNDATDNNLEMFQDKKNPINDDILKTVDKNIDTNSFRINNILKNANIQTNNYNIPELNQVINNEYFVNQNNDTNNIINENPLITDNSTKENPQKHELDLLDNELKNENDMYMNYDDINDVNEALKELNKFKYFDDDSNSTINNNKNNDVNTKCRNIINHLISSL